MNYPCKMLYGSVLFVLGLLKGVVCPLVGIPCTSDEICKTVDNTHCDSEGFCVCDFGYKKSDKILSGGCELFLDQDILIGIGVGGALLLIIAVVICVCCCCCKR